jgi:hypothetical protein
VSAAVPAGASAAVPAEVPARASPELTAAAAAEEAAALALVEEVLAVVLEEHAAATVASAAIDATAMMRDGLRRVVPKVRKIDTGVLCGGSGPKDRGCGRCRG